VNFQTATLSPHQEEKWKNDNLRRLFVGSKPAKWIDCGSRRNSRKHAGKRRDRTAGSGGLMTEKNINEELRLALELHRQNHLDEAENIYRKLLAENESDAKLYHLMGSLLIQKGKFKKAVNFLKKAVNLNPESQESYTNLAIAQLSLQEIDPAIKAYEASLSLNPELEKNWNALGALYLERGTPEEALGAFEKALKINPKNAEAWFNRGNALSIQRKYEDAIEGYDKAISFKENYFKAQNNKGNALKELGLFTEAIDCYREALKAKPDFIEACLNIGNAWSDSGKPEKALEYYDRIEAASPLLPSALLNKGNALKQMGLRDEALESLKRAIELAPENTDAHLNYGMALLLYGNFKEGWQEYEWRLKRQELQSAQMPQPKWNGANAKDKNLLVIAEQGFGDTIQSARFFPMAKERCGKVTFACRKPLLSLMKNVSGIDKLIAKEKIDELDFDIYIPNMSLPGIFNADLSSIPSSTPYIFPDKEKIEEWKEKILSDKKFRVGLCWAGSPTNTNDRNRSTNFNSLKKLLEIKEIDFYSLQKGPASLEAKDCENNFSNMTEDFKDFSDTAALIENLDLVISVDTAIAHLAGAMNKPIWLILPFEPEWRWLTERTDSPWYPSMRIFRQNTFNGWVGVIAKIKKKLEKLID
jgi:tetratricopeptide (TPR) repeat protein